jgi:transcriptional regulator with XRE-family HTH domain
MSGPAAPPCVPVPASDELQSQQPATGTTDARDSQAESLGAFIRGRRRLANLSLRQLAELTSLSNPYLSQIERGLHQPSVRALKVISEALGVSRETLLAHAGLLEHRSPLPGDAAAPVPAVESAVRADARLTGAQKSALIAVYASMVQRSPDAADPGSVTGRAAG